MKKIQATIEGISPLLMHRFPEQPIVAYDKLPKEEQAELVAYRIPQTGELFVPSVVLQRAMVDGAAYEKGKGRASLAKVVAAGVFVGPTEYLGLGTHDYEVDSRPVVMPSTKGRIMRHRPKITHWKLEFEIEYDETLLTKEQVRAVVDATGSRVGIMDFRPARRGSMGRFMVSKWEA